MYLPLLLLLILLLLVLLLRLLPFLPLLPHQHLHLTFLRSAPFELDLKTPDIGILREEFLAFGSLVLDCVLNTVPCFLAFTAHEFGCSLVAFDYFVDVVW